MLSDWDIQQYSERTMQKEGFEAGAKWARECMEKEKGVRGVSTFPTLDRALRNMDSFAYKNKRTEHVPYEKEYTNKAVCPFCFSEIIHLIDGHYLCLPCRNNFIEPFVKVCKI